MTRTEIINDVANFYNLGNRSILRSTSGAESACVYTDKNRNHCGVGRYLKPEYQKVNWSKNSNSVDNINLNECIREDIPFNIRIDRVFWLDIQMLHDNKSNWTNEGLSNLGKEKIQWMLDKYKNQ